MYLFVQNYGRDNYKMVIEMDLNKDEIYHGRTWRNTENTIGKEVEKVKGRKLGRWEGARVKGKKLRM